MFVFLTGRSECIRECGCLTVACLYKILGAAFGTTLYSDVQGNSKLHYALLRPLEEPGAMVTAGKFFVFFFLITLNCVWYIFCGADFLHETIPGH